MSSPKNERQFSSSPPLQSAQLPTDQTYAENEDLDLASDYLSDAPSDRKASSQSSSQRNYNAGDDPPAKQATAGNDLDEDIQDSTTLPSRPNKFRGPPSTWRNWTAPERDLAASFDQLQAKDLSVHLFNSFKLKRRNAARDRHPQAHISEDLGRADQESNWVPPKVWTAWPLSPDVVPREDDEKRWEEDAVLPVPYDSKPKKPGQYLQEMLIAQVLRKAKERFHDRQWGDAQRGADSTIRQAQRSQNQGRDSNGRFSTSEYNEALDQKPVIMADDQRASEILKPTVQHMMTKLDDLLSGLHHARSAYLTIDDSASESQSHISERSTSRGRPQKRRREAPKADEDAEASHDMPKHSHSKSDEYPPSRKPSGSKSNIQHARSSSRRSRGQKFHGRKGRLGLRDWSDVLGIASMTGWHQNVVGSTAARCASLFGEGIKFRSLEEGKEVREEHLYLPDASTLVSGTKSQNNTWRAREGSSNSFESGMVGGVHVDGFLESIEGKKSWKYSNKKQPKGRKASRKARGRS
ncbi:MAG: hypothetical protein ALECFALPRED_005022 [Alectoria fallacina]|uniref:Rrn9 domain-containing protein n=1 Tax=Alectoria fallacina TaxID=1903189 RepID=A0A8H3FVK8_9LECA|nr:MAG: hypothetical protein ALECFALPRED_005022 [Alectoria fallacina]